MYEANSMVWLKWFLREAVPTRRKWKLRSLMMTSTKMIRTTYSLPWGSEPTEGSPSRHYCQHNVRMNDIDPLFWQPSAFHSCRSCLFNRVCRRSSTSKLPQQSPRIQRSVPMWVRRKKQRWYPGNHSQFFS